MMKKKGFTLGLVLFLGLAISACNNSEEKKTEKVKVTPTPAIQEISLPEDTYATLKDGVYTATGGALQLKVPQEWSLSKEDATIIVAGDSEDTKDFISVQISEKDTEFKDYKKKDFEEYYNQIFDNFNLDTFEYTTVAGLDAIQLEYRLSKDDSDITEYQYMINGTYCYIINFADVSGELKDKIPEILESVVICK